MLTSLNQARRSKLDPPSIMSGFTLSPCHLVTMSLLLAAVGCADNQSQQAAQRPTADAKQESVLKDPMGYGGNTEKVDITGGGISNFDKKSFNKDVDTVFNP